MESGRSTARCSHSAGSHLISIQEGVVLAPYTWWKMGGPADHFAMPNTLQDFEEAVLWATLHNLKVTVIGAGSNVLVSDDGIEGLVLCFRDLKGTKIEKVDNRLVIETLAGTSKAEITKIFLKEKLAPALFLCGLPGDVGGGVVMNAGVSEAITPREFVEITDWIEVARVEKNRVVYQRYAHDQIQWHYRKTSGWQPGWVVKAQISWPFNPDPSLMNQVKEATQRRIKKQPLEFPSCGSVFKNPEGHKAGALIEQAGLKGFQMGGLQVSEKHANFIVNKKSDGRARDAKALIEHVQTVVFDKFQVQLQPEVQFLGRW